MHVFYYYIYKYIYIYTLYIALTMQLVSVNNMVRFIYQ